MVDKWDRRFIELASLVATWSKDPSTKVGSVVVGKNREVLTQGFNGFPRGIDDSPERLKDREEKYKYIVHAEMNCIYNACNNGISLEGATLYVIGLPVCDKCALGVVQAGIKRVVIGTPREDLSERWRLSCDQALSVFDEAGIEYEFIS